MITRRRNHKGIFLAVLRALMTGLIVMAGCTSPALAIVVQEAGNRPEAEYRPSKSRELEYDRIGDAAILESDVHVKRDVGQRPGAGCGKVTVIGPGGGGWIASIAIAPTPPGSVYVGSDVGGVYKSTNDGENWVIENNGLTNYDIRSIAFDPQNPSVVYLATTGGVFKSTDGGENWLAKRNGFPDIEKWSYSAPISALAVDPDNPDILYAGIGREREENHGQGTIYKSVDGGENWFIVNTGPSAMDSSAIIHSIAIGPSSTSTLYTGTDKGLYKSSDGGANWIAKNDGLPVYSGETAPTIRKVIVNPLESSTLYVTVRAKPNTDPWQGGVYKSTDGGESWVARSNGLANYAGGPDVDPMTTSNYRDMVIDPNNPETLYVGDFSYGSAGVYKTTDGGNSWVSTTNPTGPNQNMDLGWSWANSNVWSLAIDPSNPSRLYFGTGMALFKTSDGGDSWSQAYTRETESGKWQSIGFEHTGIFDIAVDTTDPDNVYAGYVDIGFHKSTDGGTSFQRSEIVSWHGGNVFAIAIDPDSPNIIYAGAGWWATNNGWVVKSTDYGESWTVIGSPSNGLPDAQVHSIAIDPTTPVDSRTLYVTSQDHGVYKSVDGGQSWVSISSGIGANLYVRRLVIDPNEPDLLYVGIRAKGQTIGGYGGIYKTTDGGESWTKANKNIELPDVYALVMDPSDSSILHAGTHYHYTQPSGPIHLGGVYRSVDGGENWQAVLASEFPFNIGALAISPVNPDLIFAGAPDYQYHDEVTGGGIFRSTDGGQTWQAMNEGLPMLIIYSLTAHPTDPGIVYAGSAGNGLFRIVVPVGSSTAIDTDNDNSPDCVDTDDDNDGVLDVDDALSLDATESLDTDGDGVGNNADTDDDGDGLTDELELSVGLDPLDPNDVTGSPRELLWRHTETGKNILWSMESQHRIALNEINTVPDSNWKVAGMADFNGDGMDEIFFRHRSRGENRLWTIEGGVRTSSLAIRGAHRNWFVTALGDFDADGDADLMLRNSVNGTNRYWEMDGNTRVSSLAVRTVALNWEVVGSGDFDGDGRNDLLWRNKNSGANIVWLMQGESIAERGSLPTVHPSWKVVGTGDFDADGLDDVLWRNDASGANSIWLLNGVTRKSRASLVSATPKWRVFGVIDMNGDGMADILWRNGSTGVNRLWLMNGTTRTASVAIKAVSDQNWEPVAVGNTAN